MKTFNLQYTNKEALSAFIRINSLESHTNVLVQVFTGVCEEVFINTLVKDILLDLPKAQIIGTTTDGEIMDGAVYSKNTVLSFSVFKSTNINVFAIEQTGDSYDTGHELCSKLKEVKKLKVLISFVSGLSINGEDYLRAIQTDLPDLVVAGGLAGDNAQFTGTYIFTRDGVAKKGAVGACLCSENLHINTHYNFSWENIGKTLRVTKSDKNRVYTIDGMTAQEVYRQYLGDEVGDMLPATGIEFPLIIKKGKLNIARAVLNKHDDGSLSFAGNIKEGEKVQFGYGNIESILKEAPNKTKEMLKHPIESIFVYSCMARKRLLGEGIVAELELLSKVAPMSGFFTYGEFFHEKRASNELLNQTMTTLTLSESDVLKEYDESAYNQIASSESHTVSALSHLISVTSAELQELNEDLEEKVYLKTAELENLNKDLEEKIKEETAKVQEQYKVLVDAQKSMIENEKYASLGTLVAGVAHEINTPVGLSLTGITHIQDELKKLEQAFNSQEMTESDFTNFVSETKLLAKSINTNLIKAAHLVKSFKQVAVDQSSEQDRHFNLYEYIDEILVSLHNKIKLTKIKIEVEIDDTLVIKSNPGSFSQIITNLIMNSLFHAYDKDDSGRIQIKTSLENNNLVLLYSDDGKGMDSDTKSKIFDPFFTTNRSEGGSGLGMNIIYNIVTRKLNGKIHLESTLGEGTRFTFKIPNVYNIE